MIRARSTTTRDRNLQFRGAVSTGGSLDFLLFSSIYVQFSKTSPLKSGESSEKSSGENRVKSCHVCGCHGFFGPKSKCFLDNQAANRSTRTSFWVRISSGGVGVFHFNRGGSKSLACPSKPRKNILVGKSWDSQGMPS